MNTKLGNPPLLRPALRAQSRPIGGARTCPTFTAALMQGPTPAAVIVEKIFDKAPMSRLPI